LRAQREDETTPEKLARHRRSQRPVNANIGSHFCPLWLIGEPSPFLSLAHVRSAARFAV
jgi:hypothetical protein